MASNILANMRNYEEAEIFIKKTIELNPNFAPAHYTLGTISFKLDRLNDSEISTRKAIEFNPNFESAYLQLGNILKMAV